MFSYRAGNGKDKQREREKAGGGGAGVGERWGGWVAAVTGNMENSQLRSAGKQKVLSSIPLPLSVLFEKVVVCGHRLVTLSLTINETLKWLSSLPILMQESFWW